MENLRNYFNSVAKKKREEQREREQAINFVFWMLLFYLASQQLERVRAYRRIDRMPRPRF